VVLVVPDQILFVQSVWASRKIVMNEKIQFLQWCCRKIVSHLFKQHGIVRKLFSNLKTSIRENTVITLLIWLTVINISILPLIGTSILYNKTGDQVVTFIVVDVLANIILLIIVIISVLYDIFKEEQQKLIDILKQ
jgi:quinol-cytochrome oxidoreductase complex cytochrome b subunit